MEYLVLFVLLIVLFVNAEVHLTLEGADIEGVPQDIFFTPYQFAAAVAFKAAEDPTDIPHSWHFSVTWNVQDSLFYSSDGEVKPLHHAVFHENIHKKLIPAPGASCASR